MAQEWLQCQDYDTITGTGKSERQRGSITMNTKQIEYFLAVAEELSFTRAAEKLYVSQTAVTQQIQALEELMGVKLLTRTKKRVELTPAGQAFQTDGRQILKQLENAFSHARAVSEGMTGSLEIGFTNYAGNILGNSLQEFRDCFPSIQLHFRSYSPSVMLDRLRAGELDLIFSPVFDPSAYDGCFIQRVEQVPLMVILPVKHPLTGKHYLTKEDLLQENLILACTPDSKIGEDRMIIDSFLQAGYHPKIVDKIEDVETILMMINVNMGISILPSYISLPISNRRRVVTVPYEPGTRVEYAAICMMENENPALNKMKQFLKERFA